MSNANAVQKRNSQGKLRKTGKRTERNSILVVVSNFICKQHSHFNSRMFFLCIHEFVAFALEIAAVELLQNE